MSFTIRSMRKSDCEELYQAFQDQHWNKPLEQFEKMYQKQEAGKIKVFVAVVKEQVVGYVYVRQKAVRGPFCNEDIPEICELNVVKQFRNRGIGTALLEQAEDKARDWGRRVCLGIGLHSGYGSAQRICIRRGYIPDGSGIWYEKENVHQAVEYEINDELTMYLSKWVI